MADKPVIVGTPAFSSPDPATEGYTQFMEIDDNPVNTLSEVEAEGESTDSVVGERDYDAMTKDDLAQLVDDRGIELPDEGSGKDGAFVKQDFIDALVSDDESTNAE